MTLHSLVRNYLNYLKINLNKKQGKVSWILWDNHFIQSQDLKLTLTVN